MYKRQINDLTKTFINENKRKDVKTVFYNVEKDNLAFYNNFGFRSLKIGEEAVLSTDTFTLQGSTMADIRHEVNRINRERGQFHWFTMDEIPWKFVNEIDSLHTSWVTAKKAPQLGFSLDFFPFPIDKNAYVLVITGEDGKTWGALSFFPYANNSSMALDFMIRSQKSPHGVIESGIADSMRFFKEKGIKQVSLGMAPLSDITFKNEKQTITNVKNVIFDQLNRFYQYKSLFKFKSKFNPVWHHKYVAYQSNIDLPTIMIALVQAHLKEPIRLTTLLK